MNQNWIILYILRVHHKDLTYIQIDSIKYPSKCLVMSIIFALNGGLYLLSSFYTINILDI